MGLASFGRRGGDYGYTDDVTETRVKRALKDTKQVCGYDVVKEVVDIAADRVLITVAVEGIDLRRMAYGDDFASGKLVTAIERAVGHRARQKWYEKRPRPRLAAGTHRSRG